jgi:ADP-ribose pyrophosphatase YjhB (NUDIX family)
LRPPLRCQTDLDADPHFVAELRRKVGGDHVLWIQGVTAAAFDAADRVLLIRRSDSGEWAPITGIIDPGEQPAACAVREGLEETGVRVTVQRLVSVDSGSGPVTHANGDRAQYLDLTFRCRYESGEPYPADDECIDAAWFDLEELPPMRDRLLERVRAAVPVEAPVAFAVPDA